MRCTVKTETVHRIIFEIVSDLDNCICIYTLTVPLAPVVRMTHVCVESVRHEVKLAVRGDERDGAVVVKP